MHSWRPKNTPSIRLKNSSDSGRFNAPAPRREATTALGAIQSALTFFQFCAWRWFVLFSCLIWFISSRFFWGIFCTLFIYILVLFVVSCWLSPKNLLLLLLKVYYINCLDLLFRVFLFFVYRWFLCGVECSEVAKFFLGLQVFATSLKPHFPKLSECLVVLGGFSVRSSSPDMTLVQLPQAMQAQGGMVRVWVSSRDGRLFENLLLKRQNYLTPLGPQ